MGKGPSTTVAPGSNRVVDWVRGVEGALVVDRVERERLVSDRIAEEVAAAGAAGDGGEGTPELDWLLGESCRGGRVVWCR